MAYKDANKQKQSQHESYKRNIEKYRERGRQRRKKYREWYEGIMATKSCAYCPENSIVCLEWHHTNPEEKEGIISDFVGKKFRSFENILKEMDKCIVVCSNCHRKIHAGLIGIGAQN